MKSENRTLNMIKIIAPLGKWWYYTFHPVGRTARVDRTPDKLAKWHCDYLEDGMQGDQVQPTGLIPNELLSQIKQSDCVLFLGADLPLGYPGAPLSRPELAAALAAVYQLPRDQSWPETATAFLGSDARHTLISFLKERLEGPQVQPGPLHQAIARAGFKAIVTTWFDECLEYALRDAGCRVHRVVTDLETLYGEQGQRDVTLVKLFGCISRPDSLVLTTREQLRLIGRLGQKLTAIISFATVRPLLFVGHDLCDEVTMALYDKASEGVVEHMRRAYAVWPGPTEAMRAHWQGIQLEFLSYQPAAFLEAVASQSPAVEPAVRAAIRVHKPPYKFLDYYGAKDADIFCGRDIESQIVTRLALSHRLLTLFSPSGAGKTSLLLAGVLPRLAAEGYDYVYVRALDEPLAAVRKAVAARAGRTDWEAGVNLRAFLAVSLGEKDRLVVVLDQMEELFLRVGSRDRASFFEQLAQALDQPERDVRVVFSLREDYLAHMDEASRNLPDVFTNHYRLVALDRGNARVAITEPAARAGVIVEPALADALVGRDGHGDLVETNGQVPPAALQIVMDRLYRQVLPSGHPEGDPPPPGLILSLAAYQAFRHVQGQGADARELSGAEAILAGYVREGLDRLPALRNEDDSALGADPTLGQAILQAMVTSQKTKAALTDTEILAALDEGGVIRLDDETDKRKVKAAQLGLERVRLLRSFTRDDVGYYELAHDYLAKEIAASISQAELEVRAVRELLRRQVDSWRRYPDLLIASEALRLIYEQREALRKLSPAELELIFRSTLKESYEVSYWFALARLAGVAVDAIAREGLGSDSFRTRASAVKALVELGDAFVDDIIRQLADLYPQVRVAAIAGLEHLRPDGAWRSRLKYECYVPAGEFIMGEEKKAHRVTLNAFYIGKYPVTNAEYARFMADRGRGFDMPAGKENHPVTSVSWYDAKDYADWASMRLLTEAEWEKAASWEEGNKEIGNHPGGTRKQGLLQRLVGQQVEAGTKREYPWGDTFDKAKCNTSQSGTGTTTPVGKYSPAGDSPCGAADMAGNVWEWTSSGYNNYPYDANDGRENLTDYSARRVRRGGSFLSEASDARCAARDGVNPVNRFVIRGFRVGFAPPSPSDL